MTIAERVIRVIVIQMDICLSNVELEYDLCADLGFDSLEIVELTMAIEEEFEIDIDDEVAAGWVTVGDVVTTVEGLV